MKSKFVLGIQGIEGSNHHLMARKMFSEESFGLLPSDSFRELVDSLNTKESDVALMAIENTIVGSILTNYDLISENRLKVVGEGYLPIHHQLMALPGVALEELEYAYSHEMALGQCDKFLRDNGIEGRDYVDTAAAARGVAKRGDRTAGSIAPEIAAEIYGLDIVARNIETNSSNYTRFVLLQRKEDTSPVSFSKQYLEQINGKVKTMVEFKLKHKTGSLAKVLGEMSELNFNLTKIESRPILGEAWHYRFYADFLSKMSKDDIIQSLNELSPSLEYHKILGIFPAGKLF